MSKGFKLAAGLAVFTVLLWAAMIWHWSASRRVVSTADILVYLLLLPALGIAAVLLVRKAVAASAAMPAARSAAGAAGASTAGGTTAQPAAEAAAPKPPVVLASALHLAIGNDAAAALQVLAEGSTLPQLDPELRDDNGYPIQSGRVPELDTATIDEALQELLPALAARQPQWQGLEPTPAFVRALALLAAPLDQLIEQCATEWEQRPEATQAGQLQAGLSLLWGVPAAWSEHECMLARVWLHRLLKNSALPRDLLQVQLHPLASAEALFVHLDQQLAAWGREQRPGLLAVLACDSWVDERQVQRLQQQGLLFTSRNAKGCMPGEAAAGVLLATADWPSAGPAATQLHRAAIVRRDKPADAAGRIDAAVLKQAAEAALRGSAIEPAACGFLVSDADLRASRGGEVADTALQLLPELDPAEQAVRLGLACGDLGVARALACLVLGAARQQADARPVLVMTVMHAHDRAAFVLTSGAPPAPAAGAPA
ncbi:hypothetical protein OOT46_07510 [Aquabacterium sp. A7-Y]|uniref:hypothetical protein n=1 Tax=Aquabacterium sp. A7-Y TaxID=1349605 RepID=UPI00223E777E|nr:hypothetical protein [Aquabacterium sp. A7-Y]MCW7537696.1 hypothetical protein [Aquabacterium sp. A7-Y]